MVPWRRSSRVFVAVIALALAGLGALACSGRATGGGGDPAPAATSASEELITACPATLDLTNDRACARDGMECTIPVPCETVAQQARCTCKKGRFECIDMAGTIPKGSAGRCMTGPSKDTQVCPTSFEQADGVACEAVGFACTYEGRACPDRPVHLIDYCECKRSPTDGTMALACVKGACSPMDSI
jgi:hypothetical protein